VAASRRWSGGALEIVHNAMQARGCGARGLDHDSVRALAERCARFLHVAIVVRDGAEAYELDTPMAESRELKAESSSVRV